LTVQYNCFVLSTNKKLLSNEKKKMRKTHYSSLINAYQRCFLLDKRICLLYYDQQRPTLFGANTYKRSPVQIRVARKMLISF